MSDKIKMPTELTNGLIETHKKVEAPWVAEAAEMVNGIGKTPEQRMKEWHEKSVKDAMAGRERREPKFYETMTKVTEPQTGAQIRIWRTSKEMPEYVDVELQITLSKIPASASMQEVLDIVGSIEGVTAVELLQRDGNGLVAYYEW